MKNNPKKENLADRHAEAGDTQAVSNGGTGVPPGYEPINLSNQDRWPSEEGDEIEGTPDGRDTISHEGGTFDKLRLRRKDGSITQLPDHAVLKPYWAMTPPRSLWIRFDGKKWKGGKSIAQYTVAVAKS